MGSPGRIRSGEASSLRTTGPDTKYRQWPVSYSVDIDIDIDIDKQPGSLLYTRRMAQVNLRPFDEGKKTLRRYLVCSSVAGILRPLYAVVFMHDHHGQGLF